MAAVWRLYDQLSRPRASGYFEADLAQLLQPGNEHDLRVFYLLFRRASFTLKEGSTTTFLEQALAEGKRYEQQVAQDLSGVVFESAFPQSSWKRWRMPPRQPCLRFARRP